MWRDLVCQLFTPGNSGIKLQECMFLASGIKVLGIYFVKCLEKPSAPPASMGYTFLYISREGLILFFIHNG